MCKVSAAAVNGAIAGNCFGGASGQLEWPYRQRRGVVANGFQYKGPYLIGAFGLAPPPASSWTKPYAPKEVTEQPQGLSRVTNFSIKPANQRSTQPADRVR